MPLECVNALKTFRREHGALGKAEGLRFGTSKCTSVIKKGILPRVERVRSRKT